MRDIATSALKKARKQEKTEWNVATEVSTNPKVFWRYVRDGRKVISTMSELDLDDGTTTKH